MKRLLLILLLSIGGGFALVGVSRVVQARIAPPTYHGTLLESPDPVDDFELTAHTGQRVRLSDFRGRLLVLFFGYTSCPDICPATLSDLAGALELLGERAAEVQVAMVTVDPERDSPPMMTQYLDNFHRDFVGLTGERAEIEAVAGAFGIYYEQDVQGQPGGYLVVHTTSLLVIGRDGRLRLVLPFGVTKKEIAADLLNLLTHG